MAIIRVIPIGDLALENGDVVILDGRDQIRQAIFCNFRFFLAEWFLDLREGVPYFQEILVKSPNLETVSSAFREALRKTPGVTEINLFELELDTANRRLLFRFEVSTDDGLIRVTPTDSAFIVNLG